MTRWTQIGHTSKMASFHKSLGYPANGFVPDFILQKILDQDEGTTIFVNDRERTITPLMKKRASFEKKVRKQRK
jgi:hypothetical protein